MAALAEVRIEQLESEVRALEQARSPSATLPASLAPSVACVATLRVCREGLVLYSLVGEQDESGCIRHSCCGGLLRALMSF